MSKELRDRYQQLLQDYNIVQTCVDSRHCQGLPSYLSGPQRLDIGLNMAIPVYPLQVTELGIMAGLSFRGKKHVVSIPWFAINGCYVDNVINGSYENSYDRELLRGSYYSTTDITTQPTEQVSAFPKQFAGQVHDMLNQDVQDNQKVIRVDFANRRRM